MCILHSLAIVWYKAQFRGKGGCIGHKHVQSKDMKVKDEKFSSLSFFHLCFDKRRPMFYIFHLVLWPRKSYLYFPVLAWY